MIRLLTFVLLLIPTFGFAHDLKFWTKQTGNGQGTYLPAFFDVVGVPEGHTLEGHEAPIPFSKVHIRFGHDATYIEIVAVSADREWGLTRRDGQWVRMENLTLSPEPAGGTRADVRTPSSHPVICSGWEPSWSISIDPDGTYAYELNGAHSTGRLTAIRNVRPIYGYRGVSNDGGSELSLVVVRGFCDDEGQDAYGLTAYAIDDAGGTLSFNTACCYLRP